MGTLLRGSKRAVNKVLTRWSCALEEDEINVELVWLSTAQ